MYTIATSLGELDVEDARILSAERQAGDLTLMLDSGTMHLSNGETNRLGEFKLVLMGVSNEEVVSDFGSATGETDLVLPVDLIEVVEFEPGNLTLQGHRRTVPWHSWTIRHETLAVEGA